MTTNLGWDEPMKKIKKYADLCLTISAIAARPDAGNVSEVAAAAVAFEDGIDSLTAF
jgi:hypothetical protein